MIYDFTAEDVFEMAEQLERNGAKFYREAAQNTDNPEYKKLLVGLAEMEVEHEKTFVELRSELSGNERTLFMDEKSISFLKKRLIFHP